MTKKTTVPISVRLGTKERAALDAVAKTLDRDRSYVIQEAVKNYIELHAWHSVKIEKGLAQADAGEFASDANVKKVLGL